MKKFDVKKWLDYKAKKVAEKRAATIEKNDDSNTADVEKLIEKLKQAKTDLTSSYKAWLEIGFALVQAFGEHGRQYFHEISKYHVGYNSAECDKQYDNCLNADGKGITIKTLFFHAKNNGIIINENAAEKIIASPWNDATFAKLPKLLRDILAISTDTEEKRVLLISAIGAISGIFPKVFTVYHGLKLHPNLYIFITGKAASKKGQARHVRSIVEPINKYLGMKEAELNMLILPANSSSSGFLQLLEANGGGLLYETEADTIGNAFKAEYGQYDDTFRKAFQHEPVSLYRKTDKEHLYIENPKLSCVLTGTPAQILNVVSSAENGLFSRFAFFKTRSAKKWQFHKNDSELKPSEQKLKHVGELLLEYYMFLEEQGEKMFYISDHQMEHFNKRMSVIYETDSLTTNEEFEASIKRFGIITIRIAMILATLRQLEEEGHLPDKFTCTDEDYQLAWDVVNVLLIDTLEVFESLVKFKPNVAPNQSKLLEKLPYEFTFDQYKTAAEELQISVKTAEGWIGKFIRMGMLERQGHNHYLNTFLED